MRVGRLRDKLILASLVMIVPFIVWNILLQIAWCRHDYNLELASRRVIADEIARAFAARIHETSAIQRMVAMAVWGRNSLPRSQTSAYLQSVSAALRSVTNVSAADPNGVIFASDNPHLIGSDCSRDQEVRRVVSGAKWAVGDVFPSMGGKRYSFRVVTGVRQDGRLVGLMIWLLDADLLRRALLGSLSQSHQVIITDSGGEIALIGGPYRDSWEGIDWKTQPCVRQALAGKSVVVERLVMPDGKVMLGAEVPIREIGWTAGVYSLRSDVIAPAKQEILANTLIALLLTGFMIGAAVYMGNRIANPVTRLAETQRDFGRGDLNARSDVKTNDELQSLSEGFNEMAAALQERTDQLNAALDTAHHQSERSEALYAVAQGLVVSMDLDERLEMIAHALASIIRARRSSIFLRKGSRLVGAAGWNLKYPETFHELTYDLAVGGRIIEEALDQGEPVVVPNVHEDPRMDARLLSIFDGFDVRSMIALPLMRRNRLVGLAILDNPGEYAQFDPESVENGRRLADLAAIAIENAQMFEKEKNVAHALQTSLLPEFRGQVGRFRFACEYHAALEVAQLGGDLYDIIDLENGKIGIVVADVSGKGLEAAVFTAMSKYTLRAYANEDPDPARVLTRANGSLLHAGGEWGFVTMAYTTLDTDGSLTSANAGHPPYVLVKADGEVIELRATEQNPPLGVFEDVNFTQAQHRMDKGDVLVGYTDGVTGARRDGESFEVDRLAEIVAAHRHLPPEDISHAIYRAVLDYSQGSLQDDIALIIVKSDDE